MFYTFSGPPQPPAKADFPDIQRRFETSRKTRLVRFLQRMGVLHGVFKIVHPLLRAEIKQTLAHPAIVHGRFLKQLLTGFVKSTFGKQVDLTDIQRQKTAQAQRDAWKKQVPVALYEDLATLLQTPGGTWTANDTPPIFGQSGGTSSGVPKRIPMVEQVKHANQRANLTVLDYVARHTPGQRLLQGMFLPQVGSYTRPHAAIGEEEKEYCDVSAFHVKSQSVRTAGMYAYDPFILVAESHAKIDFYVETIVGKPISCIMGATIWVEELLKRIHARWGTTPRYQEFVARIDAVLCGGMPIDPRLQSFATLGIPAHKIRGIYNSAEGMRSHEVRHLPVPFLGRWYHRFTYTHIAEFTPTTNIGSDGRLLDMQLVYTASDLLADPSRITQAGGLFFPIVTTYALPRYLLQDRLYLAISHDTTGKPRLIETILGRDNGMNEWGEELMEGNIQHAFTDLASYVFGDYALRAISEGRGTEEIRRHERIVEISGDCSTGNLTQELDDALQAHATDYHAKRTSKVITHPPRLHIVAPGTLLTYLHLVKGKFGGQAKIKHIYSGVNNEEFAQLLTWCTQQGTYQCTLG